MPAKWERRIQEIRKHSWAETFHKATWRISEKTPWLYILWHLRHLVDKLASRTLQSILSENRYVHDAGVINVQRSSQFLFFFRSHWRPEHPPGVGEEKNPRKLALTPKFGKRKYRKKSPKNGTKLIFHTHTHTHTLVSMSSDAENRKAITLCLSLFYIT